MIDFILYSELEKRIPKACNANELLQLRQECFYAGFVDLCDSIKWQLVFSYGYEIHRDGTLYKEVK